MSPIPNPSLSQGKGRKNILPCEGELKVGADFDYQVSPYGLPPILTFPSQGRNTLPIYEVATNVVLVGYVRSTPS